MHSYTRANHILRMPTLRRVLELASGVRLLVATPLFTLTLLLLTRGPASNLLLDAVLQLRRPEATCLSSCRTWWAEGPRPELCCPPLQAYDGLTVSQSFAKHG